MQADSIRSALEEIDEIQDEAEGGASGDADEHKRALIEDVCTMVDQQTEFRERLMSEHLDKLVAVRANFAEERLPAAGVLVAFVF